MPRTLFRTDTLAQQFLQTAKGLHTVSPGSNCRIASKDFGIAFLQILASINLNNEFIGGSKKKRVKPERPVQKQKTAPAAKSRHYDSRLFDEYEN